MSMTSETSAAVLQNTGFHWPKNSRTAFIAAREVLEPVLIEIRSGAANRESESRLAHDAVNVLRSAGYTKLRVPIEYGGAGLTFEEASWFLVALGQADSNLAQALRSHWLNLENLLSRPRTGENVEFIDKWLRRIGNGAIIGNAITERNNEHGQLTTTLTSLPKEQQGNDPAGVSVKVLNGTKYYCTGTAYSDWIQVSAVNEKGNAVRLLVPSDAPGLKVLDDWDGFGQQLTASGTTTFTNTPVPNEEVPHAEPDPENDRRFANGQAMAQYVHLATLVGIGQAIVHDAGQYAQSRTRSFSHGAGDVPRNDPQVLQLIGEISASIFAARASFEVLLPELARNLTADAHGETIPEEAIDSLYVAVYQAQHVIAKSVLHSATELFEIGGASATSQSRGLDRHWRNARVLASHNPIIYRDRMVGDWEVNRTPVGRRYTVGTKVLKENS